MSAYSSARPSWTLGGLVEHVLVSGQPGDRLELPVGYWECGGDSRSDDARVGPRARVGRRRVRLAPRLSASAPPRPAAAALYLSLSRGSLLAAALGLAVLGVVGLAFPSSAGRLVIVAPQALAAVLLAARIGTFGESGATLSGEVASIVALTRHLASRRKRSSH